MLLPPSLSSFVGRESTRISSSLIPKTLGPREKYISIDIIRVSPFDFEILRKKFRNFSKFDCPRELTAGGNDTNHMNLIYI